MKPEAVLAVATKSRKTGEQYLEHGNAGRAFAHFLVSLKLQPQWKSELKNPLSTSLCILGQLLEQQKRFRDLFHCYEQALEVFPENEEVLNNLGAHLFRLGHVREATHFFRKSLCANADFLPATCNLENMSSLLVERWHFRMLNDTIRNEAYREAVTKKVKQGFDSVLDIGTGTGLLSLFAADAGARQVYACECSSTMIHIAQQVLQENQMSDKICLIPKMSNDIVIPQDIPSRVSMVVTETMDAGLLGEHVLQTLSDAWDRLLLPPCPGLSSERAGQSSAFTSRQMLPPRQRYGIVVPLGASVWVAGVECPHINRSIAVPDEVLASMGFDTSSIHVLAKREDPYDSEDITKVPGGSKLLTTPQDILYINFNDPEDIKKCLNGKKETQVTIPCCEAGRLDGIVAWFSLRLDEDILLSSAPGRASCWEQAIFPLATPTDVQSGQDLDITLSCLAGKLSVNVKHSTHENLMTLSEDSVRFLNDSPWISALSQVAMNLKERKGLEVLDLSPFPLLGLQLLKHGAANKVVCLCLSEDDQKAIKLAGGEGNIEFVTHEDHLLNLVQQFDVIIIHPISKSGDLNQKSMLQIPTLRELLKSDGIFLPEKITAWGQLVSCEWLKEMSSVVGDNNVGGYKISQFVNAYQVSQHLGLFMSTLEHQPLCEPAQLMDLLPGALKAVTESYETVSVCTAGEANAIPYWFELTWGENISISTRHDSSHVCQAAILLEPGQEVSTAHDICIIARQQHGFIHLGISCDVH